MDRLTWWRTVDTVVWLWAAVGGTVLALAGVVGGDLLSAGVGALVGLGAAAKAASTL
jgi:hypothetical protein